MTLSNHFNSKSQIKRREAVDTETFGGKSLSRYFCTLAMVRRRKEVEVQVVQQIPAVITRRAFGMRM